MDFWIHEKLWDNNIINKRLLISWVQIPDLTEFNYTNFQHLQAS
jgi:hypothetical protein